MAAYYEADGIEVAGGSSSSSPRFDEKTIRGSVSFQPKPSVYSVSSRGYDYYYYGAGPGDFPDTEEVDTSSKSHWWLWLMEDNKSRQAFRILSLANLVLLLLSLPFFTISEPENHHKLQVQFIIVTALDAILSLLYTFHLLIRTRYFIFSHSKSDEAKRFNFTECIRLLSLLGVCLSLWYSVGIGVYRSIEVDIGWGYYIGFLPRAFLSVTSAVKLFLPSKVESSVLQEISTLIKWKQLCMVTLFYFIFVFIFALLGVHIIGGLDYICVYNKSVPAIPIVHCDPDVSLVCSGDDTADEYQITCEHFIPDNMTGPITLNYRTYVYYGQFRTILDGLYAVYEASTLELWNFMMVSAFEARNYIIVSAYYILIIFFIVIFLQQSIFLVVIIESFADLRSTQSKVTSTNVKQQPTKPSVVLSLENGSDTKLHLKSIDNNSPKDFVAKYGWKLVIMERVFLSLVLVDAVVTSLKRADFPDDSKHMWRLVLQIWQLTVSFAFLVEVIILFLFHLYHGQHKFFFKRPYYICLTILAFGGIVAAIPNEYFYNPLYPSNGIIIFQALRFPRLIRLSRHLQDFVLKLLGNARIPILIAVTFAIIVFLSIINAQIYAYKKTKCPDVGVEYYNNILNAFSATFQLVMNEAWTDITSELMCRTGYEWIITNLYFIIIHLFSSLIFLNFFGAIILDNLEYDEEEKQAKLEEKKRKEAKADTVPFHLRIFKKLNNQLKRDRQPGKGQPDPKPNIELNNQPKRDRPPGKGQPDPKPNIEKVEIRRFFESVNRTPLAPADFSFHDNPPTTSSGQDSSRRSSQLRQLSLVSTNDDDDYNLYTPTIEKRYQTIASLLRFAKLWRQRFEENDVTNTERHYQFPYLFGGSNGHHKGNKTKKRNEFDEFREDHRCFDQALFCMPPEHKLRRFCTFLLTAQTQTPKYELLEGKLWKIYKARLSFGIKWILSQMPYSTWIMFILLWFTVIMQFSETLHVNASKETYFYFFLMEATYVFGMSSWLLLRVLSKGLFLNPHAAISSVWDILDWIFLIDTLLLLLLVPVWGRDFIVPGRGIIEFTSYSELSTWVVVMMGIRALRPLHIISLFRSLRSVIYEILEGWKNFLIAGILMIGFIFMFASLGVQLFAGTEDNPLAFCNDPLITEKADCVGEFNINIRSSREFLHVPDVTGSNSILVPRVWFPYARDFPFNNVLHTFITLFELLTLEGWTEVSSMFSNKNAEKADWYMGFYIHIYIFLAVNLGLQLFLGVVVNNFNEHKSGHRFLLSVDQNRWIELMQRILLQRPYKLPQEPRHNILRLKLYNFVSHHHYRIVPTVFTILSTLTLVIPWSKSQNINVTISLNLIFNFYAILEVILKLLAFDATYFRSWRNLFDMFLAGATFIYYIFAIIYFSINITNFQLTLSYIALVIAVLKCVAILLKYNSMLNLLITVVTTMLRTIPLIQILFILLISYSCLGVILFNGYRKGEALEHSWMHFTGSGQAFSVLVRCLTGEDWYQLMWDVALKEPYGMSDDSKTGSVLLSVLYFGSFIVIVPFILLNVFIAVLLENFSIFYNDDDTNLNRSVIKDFKKKWRYFDAQAKSHIKLSRLKLLLRSLELQEFYTYNLGDPNQIGRYPHHLTEDSLLLWEMEEELRHDISQSVRKATSEDDAIVSFQDVLKMLAYRCEDIHTRLESQELSTRQELEIKIQIDVSEMCILRWLKKYVKPIVDWNRTQISIEPAPPTIIQPRESTAQNRQYQLFAIHNMQSQLLSRDGPWPRQASMETEDEDRLSADAQRSLCLSELVTPAVEDGESDNDDDEVVARTYAKMMSNRNPELEEGRKKATEWLQMQYEWMDNVGKNPNYFDDCL